MKPSKEIGSTFEDAEVEMKERCTGAGDRCSDPLDKHNTVSASSIRGTIPAARSREFRLKTLGWFRSEIAAANFARQRSREAPALA